MSSQFDPIVVEVRLYGTLRRHRPAGESGAPHHPFTLQLAAGDTVEQACLMLGIRDGLVNAAAVNEEAVSLSHALRDGDRLALFPQTAGGLDLYVSRIAKHCTYSRKEA